MKDSPLSFFSLPQKPKRNFLRDYLDFDTAGFERLLRTKGEVFWQSLGEKKGLDIFHKSAVEVPAYKDFLKKNKISHDKIKTIQDFGLIPPTDKRNYIQKYSMSDRSWKRGPSSRIIAASSGTQEVPTFWPRGDFQETEAAIIHELIYRYLFCVEKMKTLVVIGFPMGIYVSGVATLLPSFLVATKGYPLEIVSVGNQKQEILRVIKSLGVGYKRVVLIGHPLFIKDVVETGIEVGISWRKIHASMMLCSEEFSEEWRGYVMEKAGISRREPGRIISTYGSSEMLLMAHETPMSILMRNAMNHYQKTKEEIVGEGSLPSLFQYNPYLRYIETVNRELLFTSASGVPLIRFNLHDRGDIISFRKAEKVLGNKIRSIPNRWRLPFVALWGRSDYTVIFYAANIYPEHVRFALGTQKLFKKLTGKFTMRKVYYKNMDKKLELHIELRKGIRPNKEFAREIQDSVTKNLRKINMEYDFIFIHNPDKDLRPRIVLWPYQHEKHFKPGLKPKYILSEIDEHGG